MSIYKESKIYGNILELNEATLTKTSVNTTPLSRINKTIYYKFSVYAEATTESPFIWNAGIEYGYVITPSGGFAIHNEDYAFQDFKQGDIIQWTDPSDTYTFTILNVLNDGQTIVVAGTTSNPPNSTYPTAQISLRFDSIDVEYIENLLSENEPQQKNHFTNNTPEVYKGTVSVLSTPTNLVWQNSNKANHVSDKAIEVEILSNGLNVENVWEVELLIRNDASTSLIDNFYRDAELTNLQGQTEPLRFQNDIQNLSTYLRIKNTNAVFFREFEFIDNEYNTKIHWFNKTLSGTNTDLEIYDLTLLNAIDNSPVTGILANGETKVSFELFSPTDVIASGTNLNYFAKLNYFQLPTATEYTNNSQAFKENFYLSEFTYKPATSTFPANADFNPDTYISAITLTKINNYTVKFEFTVNSANYDYENKFACIALNIYGAKETCLICGVPEIIYKTDGLINGYFSVENFKILRHFEDDLSGGVANDVDAFKEDEFVIYKKIKQDFHGSAQNKNTRIKKVEQKIIAKNSISGESFELDNVVFNIPALPVITNSHNLSQQLVNITQNRPYTFNENFLKQCKFWNDVAWFNSFDADAYGIIYLQVAGQIRWEYYLAQLNTNTAFYNPSQSQNGLNKDWFHYQTGNWKTYEQTKITVVYPDPTLGNLDLSWIDENEITIHDYASNPKYSVKQIKTFKVNQTTFAEISNITPNFLDYEKTKVQALFTSNDVLFSDDCVIVIRIEAWENGSVSTVQHYSSYYATPSNSNGFDGLNASNKVLITQVNANTLKGECLIDNTLINPNINEFKITARIYEKSLPSKQFQDGYIFEFMSGANYNFQNQ